jgi:SAM-dependent methyltransferase
VPINSVTQEFARKATFRRSLRLLGTFKYEQTEPAVFYGAIADDSVELVRDLYRAAAGTSLKSALMLDVGGGPGYFAEAFTQAGARYVPVEPDSREMHAAGLSVGAAIRGSGMALPFRTGCADICFSSNVAEHVSDPWRMGEEMLRVTRPGGLVVLSYTVWLGPFGGHETGPWHYLGGEHAARRYRRKTGQEPKNRFGVSLFPISAAAGLRWARATPNGELLAAFPRYNPWWSWWATRVPGVRELMVSNLVLVLRKR